MQVIFKTTFPFADFFYTNLYYYFSYILAEISFLVFIALHLFHSPVYQSFRQLPKGYFVRLGTAHCDHQYIGRHDIGGKKQQHHAIPHSIRHVET